MPPPPHAEQPSIAIDPAALRAATISFARKPVPPSPRRKPSNASIASVSSAGTSSRPPTRGGHAVASRQNPSGDRNSFHHPSSVPAAPHPLRSPGPGHLRTSSSAAALAAARAASPIKRERDMSQDSAPVNGSVEARRKLFQNGSATPASAGTTRKTSPERTRPSSSDMHGVDSSSVEDIRSLKDMFERRQASSSQPAKSTHTAGASANGPVTAASRAIQASPSASRQSSRPGSPERKPAQLVSARGSPAPKTEASIRTTEPVRPLPLRPPALRKPVSISTIPSRESIPSNSSVEPRSSALAAATIAAASSPSHTPEIPRAQSAKPTPPPPRRHRSFHLTPAETASESDSTYATPDTPPALSRTTSSIVPPPLPRRAVTASAANPLLSSTTSQSRVPPPLPSRPDSTVAASLAPSRTQTPGPRKTPAPPPPPSRRQRRRSLPGPPKPILRETLRRSKSRARSRSPKRYRNHITEKERKRYEGLWAANRGLLLEPHERDLVANLVVRDIWTRSRLGFELLAEIWELVDRRKSGVLDREEFVVGTWLIDQALRGRKPPIRVDENVWNSVRRITGVNLQDSKPTR